MPARLYFDNAATSYPKPPCVMQAMTRYADDLGVSARGAYAEVREVARLVNLCRQRIATLIGARHPDAPSHVIFTLNTTDAMNLAIHGLIGHALRTSPASRPLHIITSELDHNSALRPLNVLVERHGPRVRQTRVPFDPATGLLDPRAFERAITPDTVLVATLHASNVTGMIQPAAEIGAICRKHGVAFLLDAAQSLGHVPVNVEAMGVDLLAMPGHKGLLGPTGTGALYIRPGLERVMDTVREGGTGARSELEAMPDFLPDRFEPGSHNTIGILGLGQAVQWILDQGLDRLRAHELELIGVILAGLTGPDAPPGLTLLGPGHPADAASRVGVFSFTCDHLDSATFGGMLETRFGVLSRSGLHCAPAAHAAMGTGAAASSDTPRHARGIGATRISIGPFTTPGDVASALAAIRTIAAEAAQPQLAK